METASATLRQENVSVRRAKLASHVTRVGSQWTVGKKSHDRDEWPIQCNIGNMYPVLEHQGCYFKASLKINM